SLLINEARRIALEVAPKYELFLSPEALYGVDELVQERVPVLERLVRIGKFDFVVWKGHVYMISETVARDLRQQGVRRILVRDQLVRAVRSRFAVYPYDDLVLGVFHARGTK